MQRNPTPASVALGLPLVFLTPPPSPPHCPFLKVAESQDKFDETNTREGRPRLRRRTSYSEHFPQTLPSLQSTANLSSTLGSTAGSTSRETLKLPPIGPRRNTGMHSTSSSAVGYTGGQPLDRWAKHARGRVDAETSLGWPRGAHAGFSKIAD